MSRTAAERGRMGGTATATRHGSVHMEAIGRAGFWATVKRHYGGDHLRYMQALRDRQARGTPDDDLGCQVKRVTN
ncbi:hypothetical protein [Deinococcus aquaedulcis]|uniref:hypothetical protein n=1 Tax=Deinococcus aquaedulcis TaxID=2840455 RepID=UPI001C829882|nr:hypothetical protein [Deinococcus aquaedulcis]